ncbi:phage tail tape measure protein [Anaeromassilibacillus sp. An200]|uniref:phage tail tape measure protein n=1 Tax=Anaeromassilibacillus sp. An200 TaxID=1965587 RepID=UPI000B36B62D|nr:phage tail tape measure protein [Anaeromassilibacillus sp. An200]OUP12554.1 phage tail tape measure protein [Anaeromassilibacillus sp. An200]
MTKEYEMLFRLNAQTGSGYTKAFQQAQQELKEVTQRIQDLQQEQKDITAYQKQQEALEKTEVKLNRLQKQYDNIQREIQETGSFSSELENKLLSKQVKIDDTSAAYERQKERLKELQKAMENAGIDMNDLGRSSAELSEKIHTLKENQEQAAVQAQKLGTSASSAFEQIGQALAAAGITAAIREAAQYFADCAQASMDFETAVTGVAKTTDLSDEELAAMADSIRSLSTEIPATTEEISAVAEAAGQLGIQKEALLDFTETMVMLGTATNMTADEAATALARFANITGMGAGEYDRLGATIVDLGNSFATTEQEITEMATRLASAGTLAGISEPGILALAAAMSSVGIEAEAGGTAMTETLNAIETAVAGGGEALDEFARLAGMSSETFAETWQNDALSALTSFIGGLGQLDEQGESTVLVLESLGLTGVRQSNMLKSLGLAAEQMTGAVNLANTAWEENTALTEEASKRYATTQSQLILLQNSYRNIQAAIGDAYTPELKEAYAVGTDVLNGVAQFIRDNPALVKAVVTFTGVIGGATAAVAAYTIAAKAAALASAAIPGLNIIMGVTVGVAAVTAAIVALNDAASKEADELAKLTATSRAQYAEMQELQAEYGEVCASMGDTSYEAQRLKAELDEATAAFEEQKQTAEELEAAHREAIDAHNELMASYDETVESLNKETRSSENLMAKLEELMAVEGKSASVKQEILAVVDLLNEAMPELALSYDQYADSLNLSAEAIRGVVEAELARERHAENYEQLKKLIGEEGSLYQTLQADIEETKNRQDELTNAKKQYLEYYNAYQDGGWMEADGDAYLATIREYGDAVASAQEAWENAAAAEEEARTAYEENQDAIADLTQELSGYTEEMDESGIAVQDILTSANAKVQELAASYTEAYTAALESVSGQYQLWDQAAEVVAVGADAINSALESQVSYWQSYNDNLANLTARGEDIAGLSEMIASFADGSSDSVNAVAGMASATDEELAAMVSNWQELQAEQEKTAGSMADLKTDFSAAMDELQTELAADIEAMNLGEEAAASGKATIQGYLNGITIMLPQVQAAYQRLAGAASNALGSASVPDRGFASGTPDAPPGWAWVGELGPELMRLRGGETILPASVSQDFALASQEMQTLSSVPEFTALLAAQQAEAAIPSAAAQTAPIGGELSLVVSPSYQISGSANAGEIRNVLVSRDEELVELILRTLEEAGIDAARRAYR